MAAPTKAMDSLTISKTKELKGTEKRDKLTAWEKKCQERWAKEKVFEPNPPSIDEIPLDAMSPEELREKHPKFFGCMAYPYMNGNLHAGHAFSISKVEFTGMVAAMQGKRAMTPLGFHVSGMPIKACADKLVNEIRMFGKDFSGYNPEDETEAPTPAVAPTKKEDVTKFSTKKSKSVAKTAKMKYQFQIMAASGIPKEEIHKFADVNHWLEFFPPIAKRDLTAFGSRADWRRSFVTTTANPYYDSMIRWQMTRLKELGKIKFGNRYTIYSIKDGQPCLDHDRQSGEGINAQEYTALKMGVAAWTPEAEAILKGKLPADAKVFLVAATLRPETMYGQTNCFVGPEITYGVFKASPTDYYVVTERAAKNMAYQGLFEKHGEIVKVAELPGPTLIGTLLNAPLARYGQVYVLPMASVKEGKGTGVVTSVPSDSPDDYINVMDLKKKPDFYGIKAEWIADKEIVPVIETPTYGHACAETLCKQLKISSPKDTVQLEKAKELAYKAGFYNGTMIIGEFTGEKVEVAKPKVREAMIKAGDAFAYAEPEGKVMSRSGDECIVALMDQWYLNYGEDSWKEQALDWVENKEGKGLNTYTSEAKNQFQSVLGWLNAWAVSRSFGLGSRLPWDDSQLVESLSDSTIYMAYYTLVPYLHKDIFGKEPTEYNVKPEQMTFAVWDYVFCRTKWSDELEKESGIARKTLESMRRSFQYFYPLDMRASGKDLIGNHLTFFIYNHIALFPQEYWPRGIRANGHLMVNSEKMSKSTGNFMTLHDLVGKYGADASRIALADAGDGIGDANFEEDVADNNILRLYNCREWCEEIVKTKSSNPSAVFRDGEKYSFFDKLFANDINAVGREIIAHYDATNYKLALKCIYDLFNARDFYREACTSAGVALHLGLIQRWIRNLALLLNPLAPHFAEFLWLEILGEKESIQKQLFPVLPESDAALTAQREYIKNISSAVNSAESAQLKKKAKGKEVSFDPSKPKKLTIYISASFPEWQTKYIELLSEMWNPETKSLDDKALMGRVGKMGEMKKAMPFVQTLKRRLQAGEDALIRTLAFDEAAVLVETVAGLKRSAALKEVEIIKVAAGGKGTRVGDGAEVEVKPVAESAVPGNPTYFFENV